MSAFFVFFLEFAKSGFELFIFHVITIICSYGIVKMPRREVERALP
jgi:hypothetical protein